MMPKIIFSYPWWFTVICIATGLIYAASLYYREYKNEYKNATKKVLFSIRLVAVSIIAFLLISPIIKSEKREIEKPIIVIATDNSESVLLNKDSIYYKNSFATNMSEIKSKLSQHYLVKNIYFSDIIEDSISEPYTGKATNFEQLTTFLEKRYTGRNVGAVIIASDGIYNQGNNPLYQIQQLNMPVYTIALGDTTIRRDAFIQAINHNKVAYIGNIFPVEITTGAKKCINETLELTVLHNDKTIYQTQIKVNTNNHVAKIPVKLEATEPGLQKYTVNISKIRNESSYANNSSNFYIDVIENKQSVLLLYATPHPDITAIKQSLQNKTNTMVEALPINKFSGSIKKYTLLIFIGLPSKGYNLNNIVAEADNSSIPALFIINSSTDIYALNNLKKGLLISEWRQTFNEAKANINNSFNAFTIEKQIESVVPLLPPLNAPFGKYSGFSNSDVFLFQKIGNINSSIPLIILSQISNERSGFIAGEGIWRWRLSNYKLKGNHDAFDEIINKIVQYLCTTTDKSFFRVITKRSFNENEAVEFNAELYNQSYELINSPELKLIITNGEKQYTYDFRKTADYYTLNAGVLPDGNYSYKAFTSLNGINYSAKGSFIVKKLDIESIILNANHHLLFNIAKNTGAKMFFPAQLNDLYNHIRQRKDIVAIQHSYKSYTEIISYTAVLIFVLLLLSLEWFIRKWKGGY